MRSIDQTVRLSPRQWSGPMQSFRRGRIRLQRNHATRCAGKPAASALPRACARRGNSSLELSTRRRSLRLEGGAYEQFAKKGNNGAETRDSAVTKEFLSCESGWSKTSRRPL